MVENVLVRLKAETDISQGVTRSNLTKEQMQKLVIARQFVSAIVTTVLINDSIKLKSWYVTRNLSKHILAFIHNFTDFGHKVTKIFSNRKVKERL